MRLNKKLIKKNIFSALGFILCAGLWFLSAPQPANAAAPGCYLNQSGKYVTVPCSGNGGADSNKCYSAVASSQGQAEFSEAPCDSIRSQDTTNSVNTLAADCSSNNSSVLGVPTWYKYLTGTRDKTGGCVFKIEKTKDLLPVGIAVLEIMLRLAGLVATAFIVVGGVKYITSQGEPESAKNAKSTIINSLIGLMLVLLSVGIVNFVGNRLSGTSTSKQTSLRLAAIRGKL
jgi:hypothetical protein